MSALPSGRQSNTTCLPSGDQLGDPASGPRNEVRRIGFSPSLSQTQISSLPERLETNAIRLPSGEKRGLASRAVETINLARGCDLSEWPSSCSLYISVSTTLRLQASRVPSLENAGYRASLPVAAIHSGAPPSTGILSRRL